MRWVLVGVYVAAVGLAIWGALREEPPTGLIVQIDAGYATPDQEDVNALRLRSWSAPVRLTLESSRRCAGGEVKVFQSGRVVDTRRWSTRHQPTRVYLGGAWGTGITGLAVATCVAGPAAGLRGTALIRIHTPRMECTHRALRVLDLRGKASTHAGTLNEGDLLPEGALVRVQQGRVVVGAPECNGFRALLLPGATTVGGYDPNGRGAEFRAERIVVASGDEHAGPYGPLDGDVQVFAQADPCVDCALPSLASFAARSRAGRTVVRVYAASVFVGRFGTRRRVRVRAGEQLFVRCVAGGTCRFGSPVLFQPNEPLALEPRRARPLARRIRGSLRPALEQLAPDRSTASLTEIRDRTGPRLLLVSWRRGLRVPAGRPVATGKGLVVSSQSVVTIEKGLLIWQRRHRGWQLAYDRRYPEWHNVGVRRADLTRDGVDELLVTEWNGGTAYCGLRRVVAEIRGVVRDIFRRHLCELDLDVQRGNLLVRTPVGPCPVQPGSVHCFGGSKNELLRWNGSRLAPVRVWASCVRANLDPLRSCAPR